MSSVMSLKITGDVFGLILSDYVYCMFFMWRGIQNYYTPIFVKRNQLLSTAVQNYFIFFSIGVNVSVKYNHISYHKQRNKFNKDKNHSNVNKER